MEDYEGENSLTPVASAVYERAKAGINIVYTDNEGEHRNPTAVESDVQRVFDSELGNRFIDVNDDGSAIIDSLWLPERGVITRIYSPEGQLFRTRLSGVYFMKKVTNDNFVTDQMGKLHYQPVGYSDDIERAATLKELFQLRRKLREIRH